MSLETVVGGLVLGVGGYALCGVVFAALFLVWGLERVDPASRESTWGFRLVVLPAVVALWPLLLRRWRRGPGHGGSSR